MTSTPVRIHVTVSRELNLNIECTYFFMNRWSCFTMLFRYLVILGNVLKGRMFLVSENVICTNWLVVNR